MAFPLSWSGEVRVTGGPNHVPNPLAAAAAIESAIASQRPKSVSRIGTVIDFRAGARRLVSKNNVLVPITRGHVDVQPELSGLRIFYTIYFTEVLVFSLLLTAVFGLVADAGADDTSVGFRGLATLLPLLWLFGGNVAITLFRFPRLLKRAAAAAT